MSGGGSGSRSSAPTAQTAGSYTKDNFPWEAYAQEFGIEPGWSGSAQNNAWEHFVKSGASWTPTPPQPPIPPFMPGNQSALAQQLAMGFGGTPESFLQSPLMNLFQPMDVSPKYTPPATEKKKR